MSKKLVLAAIALLILTVAPARSDDKTECSRGIAKIKAAIAKKPPPSVLATLRKALDDAEQETIEADWSECVTVVREGQKAIKK